MLTISKYMYNEYSQNIKLASKQRIDCGHKMMKIQYPEQQIRIYQICIWILDDWILVALPTATLSDYAMLQLFYREHKANTFIM